MERLYVSTFVDIAGATEFTFQYGKIIPKNSDNYVSDIVIYIPIWKDYTIQKPSTCGTVQIFTFQYGKIIHQPIWHILASSAHLHSNMERLY